jgi:hypothetical protein
MVGARAADEGSMDWRVRATNRGNGQQRRVSIVEVAEG